MPLRKPRRMLAQTTITEATEVQFSRCQDNPIFVDVKELDMTRLPQRRQIEYPRIFREPLSACTRLRSVTQRGLHIFLYLTCGPITLLIFAEEAEPVARMYTWMPCLQAKYQHHSTGTGRLRTRLSVPRRTFLNDQCSPISFRVSPPPVRL
jgi:hypothetical protein